METRFSVFDVETPNARNDRMSAIGITLVEDGRIAGRFASLINPETGFDLFNIQLTGITPASVRGKPTFGELWDTLRPLLEFGTLCAHNAPFDLAVLSRCLEAYRIPWITLPRYICTCRYARKCFPYTENHRLNTLADCLKIPLDHHRADSDSLACARILLRCMESGVDHRPFLRLYDMKARRTLPLPKNRGG